MIFIKKDRMVNFAYFNYNPYDLTVSSQSLVDYSCRWRHYKENEIAQEAGALVMFSLCKLNLLQKAYFIYRNLFRGKLKLIRHFSLAHPLFSHYLPPRPSLLSWPQPKHISKEWADKTSTELGMLRSEGKRSCAIHLSGHSSVLNFKFFVDWVD